MTGQWAAARSSRIVIVSVVVAAVAITAFCLVGIAVLLGWVPRGGAIPPAGMALPAQQVTGTEPPPEPPPNDPRVAPIDRGRSEPLMPKYSQPAAPAPAPDPVPAQTPPKREAPLVAARKPLPPPPPAAPEPRERVPRGACVNCGTVSTITTYPGRWEVNVRFEDGESRTFRYRSRPPFGVGDRVRLDDEFLVHD